MKKTFYTLLIAALGWIICSPMAQGQDVILSQFYAAPMYLNPAFTGSTYGLRASLHMRSHPLPDATGYSALSASADGYLPYINSGLGIVFTSDYQGNLVWKNHASLLYAYHLRLSRNWNVNFGAQAGYYGNELRWDNLEFTDPGQPPPPFTRRHAVNFATGLLAFNDFFYGGVAMHHLNRPQEGFFGDQRLDMKYTAHIGANIMSSQRHRANTQRFAFFLSPNVIYQGQGPFHRINYGMYAGVDRIMGGVWFRQDMNRSNTMVFLVGFNHQNYRIGYSYDHSLSGFTDAFHAVHEISLSWQLEGRVRKRMPHCPDF